MPDKGFTPALGSAGLTRSYDHVIRLLTREQTWRGALLRQVGLGASETVVDVGCGTGTFAILMKRAVPTARVIGIDPDPVVLRIAAEKAERAGLSIEWRQGFADDAAAFAGGVDKAVSSLVFHQVPMDGKREGVAGMFAAVRSGGEVHIADYARQPTRLMRALFRLTVQLIDGETDTQPNADGALETILAKFDGSAAVPIAVIPTLTGAISLFRGSPTAA